MAISTVFCRQDGNADDFSKCTFFVYISMVLLKATTTLLKQPITYPPNHAQALYTLTNPLLPMQYPASNTSQPIYHRLIDCVCEALSCQGLRAEGLLVRGQKNSDSWTQNTDMKNKGRDRKTTALWIWVIDYCLFVSKVNFSIKKSFTIRQRSTVYSAAFLSVLKLVIYNSPAVSMR